MIQQWLEQQIPRETHGKGRGRPPAIEGVQGASHGKLLILGALKSAFYIIWINSQRRYPRERHLYVTICFILNV